MNKTTSLAGAIIHAGARALGGLAAERLWEQMPDAEAASIQPFESWKRLLIAQLEDLAGTLAVDRPRLFVAQVQEQQAVVAARGVPPEIFRAALQALRDVLVEKLSPLLAETVSPYFDQALAGVSTPQDRHESEWNRGSPLARMAAEYLLAVLEGDRHRAWHVVRTAASEGTPLEDLYRHLLAPAQAEIGRMWMQDEANIAEEHFVSSTTKWVVTRLQQLAVRQPPHGKTLLAAGVAGNQMDVGLHMLGDLFEIDGWQVVQLGADVPADDLAQAVELYQVDVVGLSVAMNNQFTALQAAVQAIRTSTGGQQVKILVGGRALEHASDLKEELDVDAIVHSLADARDLARQLTGLPPRTGRQTPLVGAKKQKEGGPRST